MKKATILLMFLFAVITVSSGQTTKKIDPVGTWKFDAPYAPEGYTSGTIVIGLAENKHTATMSFAGSEYKFSGKNVKVENDTVSFSIFLEGQDIKVSLKGDADAKLVGKAVYSEGEVPLTLTKNPAPAK
ncbi:MAG: hypothetical protein IPJ16_12955 [Bacteroidales bacterium]|nr:hypothetical protein [Bacteroidales bacterium]